MQRPRLSVPKGYSEVPPADHIGGSSIFTRSWLSGSLGAICGANSAHSTIATTITAPITTFGDRPDCRKASAKADGGFATLGAPELGIENDIENVHDGIDQKRGHAEHERDALDQRQIVIAHGLHHQVADPGIGEDG